MLFKASRHNLDHIVELIGQDYKLYGPILVEKNWLFRQFTKPYHIPWNSKRTTVPFKKFFIPNKHDILSEKANIALLALPLCDVAALNLFLKQFENSGLVLPRKNIFIVGSDCTPDEHCFCDQFGLEKYYDFDLFISVNKNDDFFVSAKGWRAKEIITKCGLKASSAKITIKPKITSNKIDLHKTEQIIDNKQLTHDFWQGIANNCFGCGACSAVCPLCFCFDQDFENQLDGSCKRCLNWTNCFAADFSQIQFGHDLRPTNTDRLYNWYHHKFVRAPHELGHPTCVGCGRCIVACPAHLNIKSIIKSLNKKYGSKK